MNNSAIKFAPDSVLSRKDLDIRSGDTVKVYVKIVEKGKTRIQIFEGLVLAVKHGKEAGATFTVRKISNGIGVERIFPIYSPAIEKIEITKRSRTRRSKLYFLRTKVARDIRRKMRNLMDFVGGTDQLIKEQQKEDTEMFEDSTTEKEPIVDSTNSSVEEVVASEKEEVKEEPVTEEEKTV